MKLNKTILVILSLFTFMGMKATDESNYTTISGQFSFDPSQDSIKLFNVVDGQLNLYSTTLINGKNQFGFSVPVVTPGFYLIDYGQMRANRKDQLIRFYLEPGLDIALSVDEKAYVLTGKKLGHNELVQKANKIYDEFALYSKLGGIVTFENFYPFMENEGPKMVADFKKTINTKDKAFNDLLKLAVQADFEGHSYMFFRMPRTKHPENFTDIPAVFNTLVKEDKFSNPDILKLINGFLWMDNYFALQMMQRKPGFDKMNYISTAIKDIPNDRLKEVFIYEKIKTSKYKPEEYEVIIQPFYQYLTSDKSKSFIVNHEKELHKYEGQPGFNFTYKDIDDKPVSFSDFKGKYVYIDVWATWCGPCKKEIPFLKTLEQDYQDEDIVFVSISVDQLKDKQKWKDMVLNEELKGVQLMADKDFNSGITKNYEINGIPRFLLFDKEGKIISIDAMRPSNPLIRDQFNKLLEASK